MISLVAQLRSIAQRHKLAVLATNHMVRGTGSARKPALGSRWSSLIDVRLALSKFETHRHVIELVKAPSLVLLPC